MADICSNRRADTANKSAVHLGCKLENAPVGTNSESLDLSQTLEGLLQFTCHQSIYRIERSSAGSKQAKPAYGGVATVYGYLDETYMDKALPVRTDKQRGRGQINPPSLVSRQTFKPY